jgi:2-polyprenyl-6-methoxyphenol hydroxylase-like FAD-dependent oxidoreductase
MPAMFASFSLFWTVTPLMLAGPLRAVADRHRDLRPGRHGRRRRLAGRRDAWPTRGHTLFATAAALLLGIVSFALPLSSPARATLALGVLVVASIVLDMGVAANLVLGQRAIFALGAEVRSRLNGIFFACSSPAARSVPRRRLGLCPPRLACRAADRHGLPGRRAAVLGRRIERIEQAGGQVRAVFASGRVETGDLLIGADGARSTVRSLMLPAIAPNLAPDYAGYIAWRGLVPEEDLDADSRAVLDGVFAFQHDEGEQMLLEYLVPGEDGSTAPGRRRWNWVWYRKVPQDDLPAVLTDRAGRAHAFSLPPGALPDARAALLRADARELLAPQFNALVQKTEEPFAQAILDLAAPRMVFGRVLLLGDAAFVPRPHTAGGAAKAAANALALAQALHRTDQPVDARLRDWEVLQLRAGRAMVDWGRRMGDGIMGVRRAAGCTDSRAGTPGP